MRYVTIPARELTPQLIERWASIQSTYAMYSSPYFRPEFTQCVAAARDDAYVCLLEDRGIIRGFFPFHRNARRAARPIGLGLSDYQGVIVEPSAEWSAEELLRGCGAERWDFDHLIASQSQFAGHHELISDSPIIEVSAGFDVYTASRDKSARKQLREVERKRKRLAEDIGPLSISLHSSSSNTLRQLFTWKSEQCRQTGTFDFFGLPWCVELIERIHSTRELSFGGMLAEVYAGATLAAVHFAMYTGDVWHSWFPTYNHDLDSYSPGSILLMEIIQAAAEHRIQHIDLGKGASLYKKRVMTGGIPVATGSVALPSLRNRFLDLTKRSDRWGERSIAKQVLRVPKRFLRNRQRKRRYV